MTELPRRLVIATHNPGKMDEFKGILAPWAGSLAALSDVAAHAEAPEETGETYADNARIKAEAAVRATKLPCLADDSGIEVAALDGGPGPLSARFAGEPSDADANNALLLAKLAGVSEAGREACYVAHLVLALPDGRRYEARGEWRGRVVSDPKGVRGFGYDPLFLVPLFGCTVAEMPTQLKNRVSHRARAARQLYPALLKLFSGD